MNLNQFRTLYDEDRMLLTVCADATRDSQNGEHEVALRWRGLREQLDEPAAAVALDAAEPVLLAPTGLGGQCARTLVIDEKGEVLLDRVTTGPAVPFAHWGPFPRLTGLISALDRQVNHVLVALDRTGADIEVHATSGEWSETVEGSAVGPVHKVHAGGWADLRWQHRVENTGEANIAEVADRVGSLVRAARAEVVVVTGDPRNQSLFQEAVDAKTAPLVSLLDGGGRGPGQEGRLPDELTALLEDRAARRAREAAELFREAHGRAQGAAQGLAETVAALRAAAVDTLLLPPDWLPEDEGWYGPSPEMLGLEQADLAALGVPDPGRAAVADLVVRAAVGTPANAVVVPPHILDLGGQPAAILRYDPTGNGG
jgi:hypothetical protein